MNTETGELAGPDTPAEKTIELNANDMRGLARAHCITCGGTGVRVRVRNEAGKPLTRKDMHGRQRSPCYCIKAKFRRLVRREKAKEAQ